MQQLIGSVLPPFRWRGAIANHVLILKRKRVRPLAPKQVRNKEQMKTVNNQAENERIT